MFEIPLDIEDIERLSAANAGGSSLSAGEEGVVVVKQGIIRKSNEAMARLSGYGHEEVVDTIFASFFHRDDIPLVESICDPIPKLTEDQKTPVVRLIGKNGQPIPVRISVGARGKGSAPSHRIKIRNI